MINNTVPDGYFLIGSDVKFTPITRELAKLDSGEKIHLQTPASQCLVLLLQKQGSVITRDELTAFAWGSKNSSFVSSNNFYQAISHLRKALLTLGLADLVQTIPKRGITIGRGMDVNYQVENGKSEREVQRIETSSCFDVSSTKSMNSLITAIFLAILAGVCLRYFSFDHDIFDGYKELVSDGCLGKYNNDDALLLLRNTMSNIKEYCASNATLYATNNKRNLRESVIYCIKNKQGRKECYIHMNIKKKNDES
ncbi:TPA: winged helix-turn-helix domain-containing protein [Klebsiella oxytoca]|nr:winged helix-turn-helix domain-containing protein [Klebsiella oxytoca]